MIRLAGTCIALVVVGLAGCSSGDPAQRTIDRAQEAHGSHALEEAVVTFDFRGKHFRLLRDAGAFSYERTYTDSSGSVREVLNNDTLYREVNGARALLTEAERLQLEEDINSMAYFTLLPRGLDDEAVRKRYLGEVAVEGAPYHMVEVTFRQEGGGRGYEDRFLYWIHPARYTIDYLAYYFHTGRGGSRFRKAVNERTVQGVRFADFENYTAGDIGFDDLERYAGLAGTDSLRLLSMIEIDHVAVQAVPETPDRRGHE